MRRSVIEGAGDERLHERLHPVVLGTREDRHVLLVVLATTRQQLDNALEHAWNTQTTDAERVLPLRHLVLDSAFALHEPEEHIGDNVNAILRRRVGSELHERLEVLTHTVASCA